MSTTPLLLRLTTAWPVGFRDSPRGVSCNTAVGAMLLPLGPRSGFVVGVGVLGVGWTSETRLVQPASVTASTTSRAVLCKRQVAGERRAWSLACSVSTAPAGLGLDPN